MEDLFGVVASPNPSLLFLVPQEEAVGSILIAAEAIGIQGNGGFKFFDQQGNVRGSCNFLQMNQLREIWMRWRRRRQRQQRLRKRTIQPGRRSG